MGRLYKSEGGFSFLELITVTAVLTSLVGISISNYSSFASTSKDTVAITDYRNFKTVVIEESGQENSSVSYRYRRITGPAILPGPLSAASLSSRVRLYQAIKRIRLTRRGPREIIRFELGHLDGNYRYRFVMIDGIVVEQVISD